MASAIVIGPIRPRYMPRITISLPGSERRCEVLVIDRDEEKTRAIADVVTCALSGDVREPEVLSGSARDTCRESQSACPVPRGFP